MALVGDIIIQARILGPDKPLTLGPPTGLGYAVAADATSTLPAATYFVKVTQFNSWGETISASESGGQVVAALQKITVSGTAAPGATKVRAYFGTTLGGENAFVESTTFPIVINSVGTSGFPPINSSAYLPDQDGQFVSAASMYKWLNGGLKLAARYAGGIRDVTGIPSVIAQPMYTLTGTWDKLTQGWYDGYVMDVINKRNFFYANTTNGLSWGCAVSYNAERAIIETFPQPQRTAGLTTTTTALTLTGTSLTLTDASSFVLPFGLALINNTEIVAYAPLNGNSVTGLIRGLGGTVPAAYASGVNFQELNIRFAGLRKHFTDYSPGQSAVTLRIPDTWADPLALYLLSYFREGEQDREGAKELRQEFEMTMKSLKANEYPGPFQIGEACNREVYGGGIGGGWLIP